MPGVSIAALPGISWLPFFDDIATGVNVIGIKLFGAFLAASVGKMRLGMIANIGFDLLPISIIVAYFFACCTDGKAPSQNLNFIKRFL